MGFTLRILLKCSDLSSSVFVLGTRRSRSFSQLSFLALFESLVAFAVDPPSLGPIEGLDAELDDSIL